MDERDDMLNIADKTFSSRLIMGTALYPSPEIMAESVKAGGAELVTVARRRQNPADKSGVVNGNFVPQSQHAAHILKDADEIEIVAPMQGG